MVFVKVQALIFIFQSKFSSGSENNSLNVPRFRESSQWFSVKAVLGT